ncbi:hypothetical protein FS749_013162, partial [Ceratobasidium sp. UAMH 11750]
MAKNPENIMEFYALLSEVRKEFKIKAENEYNMDEKGYQIGESGSEKVIVVRRSDHRQDGHAGGVKQ